MCKAEEVDEPDAGDEALDVLAGGVDGGEGGGEQQPSAGHQPAVAQPVEQDPGHQPAQEVHNPTANIDHGVMNIYILYLPIPDTADNRQDLQAGG